MNQEGPRERMRLPSDRSVKSNTMDIAGIPASALAHTNSPSTGPISAAITAVTSGCVVYAGRPQQAAPLSADVEPKTSTLAPQYVFDESECRWTPGRDFRLGEVFATLRTSRAQRSSDNGDIEWIVQPPV